MTDHDAVERLITMAWRAHGDAGQANRGAERAAFDEAVQDGGASGWGQAIHDVTIMPKPL
jgi:hypothetical protein